MIIFGAGIRGKKILKCLNAIGVEVEFFCDNNEKLWGKEVENVPVISPSILKNRYINNEIIIANKSNVTEIKQQLEMYGASHILTLEEAVFFHKRIAYVNRNLASNVEIHTSDNPILSIVILDDGNIERETITSIYNQRIDVEYEIVQWRGMQTRIKGKKVLCIGNGSVMQNDSISELMESEKIRGGIVGSKSVRMDGIINQAGYVIKEENRIIGYGYGESAVKPEYEYVRSCDAISINGMMFDVKYWESVKEKLLITPNLFEASIEFSLWMREQGESVTLQPYSLVVEERTGDIGEYFIQNASLIEKCKTFLDKCECKDEGLFWLANREKAFANVLMVDGSIARFDTNAGNRSTYEYILIMLELNVRMIYLTNDFFYDYEYVKLFQKKGVFVLYGEEWQKNCEFMLAPILAKITYAFLNRPNITASYIELIRRYSKALIVHYGHDLHYLRLKREYDITGSEKYLLESEKYKELEHRLVNLVDITGYPSGVEVNKMKELHPDKDIQFFPLNFFEDTEFERKNKQRKGLIFVGGFAHSPNEDAAIWLVEEILPLLRKQGITDKIYLVGSNPTHRVMDLQSKDVEVTGYVTEEELEAYYEECCIAIIPLRYGAGMKGKVLEALYKGIPVVTTDIGAEGLENYEGIINIGNTAEEIVEHIHELYKDKTKLWDKGKLGREYVLSYFGKKRIYEMLSNQIKYAIEKCNQGKEEV